VVAGGHALLLSGDLDAGAERELLARWPPLRLAADVVVMSRQAGAAGSDPEWIESSGAGLAIATGGLMGDARARTLARWRGAGVRVLDTRTAGAVQFVFGTRGIVQLATARSARYPFAWRRPE
jgi:competence protein ComEC